jgi:hypothetical protein
MDLIPYDVTPGSRGNVQLPRFTISGKGVDSNNQSIVIYDFTGVNAIQFPAVIDTLTADQQRVILDLVIRYIINIKAGQPTGL